MIARRASGCAAVALSVCLAAAPAAGVTGSDRSDRSDLSDRAATGAVVVGQNFESPGACPPSTTALQLASGDGTDYTVRSAGVLTSFSTIMSGGFRGLVMRPAAAGHYSLVGATPLRLGTSLSTPTTVAVRIPVQSGDLLGIDLPAATNGCAVNTGNPADVVEVGTFATPTDFMNGVANPGQRINIAAVLEPDVDGDGYGDVSQDGCPALATLQTPCPTPDTGVKHPPAKVVHHPLVRFKLTSTVPGSTYQCSVDGRRFKTCKHRFEKPFAAGRHTVLARAVSPLGFTDATPVKVRFRVEPR